jgi:hypothetical protein
MSQPIRITAARLYKHGLPTAAAVAITAVLAPFGTAVAAGLAALVGAGAWAGVMRRASTEARTAPDRFIGS